MATSLDIATYHITDLFLVFDACVIRFWLIGGGGGGGGTLSVCLGVPWPGFQFKFWAQFQSLVIISA